MALAQVDRLNMPIPSTSSDLTGHHTSSEHVASGIFSPTRDADLLREAALRSRKARKQTSTINSPAALSTTAQQTNAVDRPPAAEEDVQMEDATINAEPAEGSALHPVNVDTEDGEIFEETQNKTDDDRVIELDFSGGERASSLATLDNNTSAGPRQPSTLSSGLALASLDDVKTIRPFLKMTARDLDEAKRLVLDLLGMGVTPEYLVDCGISSQCLAICFYELGLRFPLNLDRSQIALPSVYNLDTHMQESIKLAGVIRQRHHDRALKEESSSSSSSSALTPDLLASKDVALPSIDRGTSIHVPRRGSLPSPPASLPSRPVILPPSADELRYDTEPVLQRKANTSARLPPTGPRAERTDPAIAEEQKRMELLARKAAMDSIAKKRAAKPSPNSDPDDLVQPRGIENEDVDSAVDALLAAVSMDSASGPLGQLEASPESSTDEALPEYDSDAMVEDELDARSTSISDVDDEAVLDPVSVLGDKQHLSPTLLSSAGSSPRLPPVVPSPRIRFEPLDGSMNSGTFTPSPQVTAPIAARRSRPTASDFIDQAPPRPSSAFVSEAPLKRKRCFVDPQVWPRRLVIDLDSSDEEDEDEDDGGARYATGVPSTSSSRGSVDRSASNGGGGRPGAKQGSDMAAQMLLEKELQIKAMMQKIKMRELKKKIGSASGTPVLAAASAVSVPEGLSAVFPPSTVTTPPALSDADTIALEATKQETAAGVASTLEIQQELVPTTNKLPSIEASESNDNTLDSTAEISVPKLDKGKGKATEPEDIVEGPQDSVMDISTAARLYSRFRGSAKLIDDSEKFQASAVNSTLPAQYIAIADQNINLTHFKTYRSPLAAFTSPNLQPPTPTDRQLPTIYWISSTAGQDTNRKLCQYEFPSGVCKDQACADIHARDLSASDDDVRRTVAPMFPNAGPQGLTSIVRRVRQSAQPEV